MATTKQKPKLLVIVGPTASGKSNLALKVAKEFNGEIVAADSRTIYKGMNLGTAKPPLKDRKIVKHWGFDLVNPGQSFSAAKFKKFAESKIVDIQKRDKLPILVGGTGLYIDSVLFNFSLVKTNKLRRLIYSSWSVEKLQKLIEQKGWPMPENMENKLHLVAVAARKGRQGTKNAKPRKDALIIGLMPTDEAVKRRLQERAKKYFLYGIIEETRWLLQKYGQKKLTKTGGIAYLAVIRLIKGQITSEQAVEQITKQEWQYARRQRTWFKRNKFINWFDSSGKAYKEISSILNN
jgi:tRNA dimethylallyltransferase